MKSANGTLRRLLYGTLFLAFGTLSTQPAFAGQPLETETARLLSPGAIETEAVVEVQHSSDGRESAVPLLFEMGFQHNWEVTVEPVPYTAIRPRHSGGATGQGDLEVTLTHLLAGERASLPAIAIAGEVKLPTAKNDLIGTGETDYTVLAILSKRHGRFDSHLNAGYTIVGSPAGTSLNNIFDYALATEFKLTPAVDLVGEIIGNTSSAGENGGDSSSGPQVIAEAAGGETSVLIGARYKPRPGISLGAGLSYDNNQALLLRTGITIRFGRR